MAKCSQPKKRQDISDYVYKFGKKKNSAYNWRSQYFEIDGSLYDFFEDYYASIGKNTLKNLEIDKNFGFNSDDDRSYKICKCLNKDKFRLYSWGYEGVAICLDCGNEIIVYGE